jgi:hypothetical protein
MIRNNVSVILLALALSSGDLYAGPTNSGSPEDAVRETLRQISVTDFSVDDGGALLSRFTALAMASGGTSADTISTLTIAEALKKTSDDMRELHLSQITMEPIRIRCKQQESNAQCTLALQTSFPEVEGSLVESTASYGLMLSDGEWLISSSMNFILLPDTKAEEGAHVVSYPVLWSETLAGTQPEWTRPLPFLAQQVVDLGYDLPNPFGVAVVPLYIRQDMIISDLEVGVNDGPMKPVDSVQFGTGRVENGSVQLKFDAWIFPFLNAFVSIGKVSGDVEMPLQIDANGLLDGLDPAICSGIFRPSICDEQINVVADLNYEGETLTLGINVAGGWEQFFFTLPASYTWSDINLIDSRVEALNISPRIGVTSGATEWGVISTFVGGTYLSADVDVTGSVSVSGLAPGSEPTELNFKVNQRNKDEWNYLVGFNWDIDKNWSVHAEGGFGGSRENFIASATYRF